MNSSHFVIEKSRKTPAISFIPEQGKLEIIGQSLPEDAQKFYLPLFTHIDKYLNNPMHTTQLYFQLDYFNTISSKIFLQIMQKFENLVLSNKEVEIVWAIDRDDPDMLEVGRTFISIVKIPFTILELEEV